MGNCHSVGEQRSVRTQTLRAIPVFKPLTGQCTGMAPICIKRDLSHDGTGADPGFFLGGGALVSCSTSTPINHIVFFFFAEYQLY